MVMSYDDAFCQSYVPVEHRVSPLKVIKKLDELQLALIFYWTQLVRATECMETAFG